MMETLRFDSEIKRKNVLAPSRSTAYISNLPFSLTNSDLFKIFSKYGKVVRVTIMKDKTTRKSKGVAFLLFSDPESAWNCVKAVNDCDMFGRTLKANIAKDNGRASEFIKRREYPDKSRCYECGKSGHLSYTCPQNLLGTRDPPPKKKKIKNKMKLSSESRNVTTIEDDDGEEFEDDFEDDSLSAAIRYQQELREGEEFLQTQVNGRAATSARFDGEPRKKRKLKQSAYFSDEEELSD